MKNVANKNNTVELTSLSYFAVSVFLPGLILALLFTSLVLTQSDYHTPHNYVTGFSIFSRLIIRD